MKSILKGQEPKGCTGVFWIDSEAAFCAAVEQLLSKGMPHQLFIDTEFERSTTYYPIGCLLQICAGSDVFLIDLTQCRCPEKVPEAFLDLLTKKDCLKVLHAGREDIDLLAHMWGIRLDPIFDTQWAASFLFDTPQLGLASLLEKIQGVDLDKSNTRSDWLQRPLTQAQLEYAVLDVWYLKPIFDRLFEKLHEACLWDEVITDCQWIYQDTLAQPLTYLNWYSDGWFLEPKQKKRLAALFLWRDNFLKRRNIPKSWGVPDRILLKLASSNSIDGSNRLKTFFTDEYKFLKRYFNSETPNLMSALSNCEVSWNQLVSDAQGCSISINGLPSLSLIKECQFQIPPLCRAAKPMLKELRAQVAQTAQLLNWRADQLCRKNWLIQWLRIFLYCTINELPFERGMYPSVWQSWRGDLLLRAFEGVASNCSEHIFASMAYLTSERDALAFVKN